ncbi:DUF1835 domain-containing protein [Endothiovibrio diazotrophicus]
MSEEPRRDCNSPRFHGHLNLEQQRKRAKELLKGAKSGDPEALGRLNASLGTLPDPLKLSDAQRVVARECGFACWPRLKHHIEAIDFARDHVGRVGDRDLPTLHIRCGSDIQQGLKSAGFTGEFLEFSDPFCMGPVPALPLEEHLRSRARYTADAFGLSPTDALARLRQGYGALERLDGYRRIVLWFEHDSYDQLILAYLLMRFAERPPAAQVELIAVDHVPGVERFIGIGQLSPELLGWLWGRRVAVGEAQFRLGERVWRAITDPSPEALHRIAREGTPAVPMMAAALARHLRELPDWAGGLGLTERLTLEICREWGEIPLGRAFAELMGKREPLPYLGDVMFFRVVHELAMGPRALVRIGTAPEGEPEFRAPFQLTDDGEAVLAGRVNRLDLGPPVRWVGGVRCPAEEGSWCWDGAAGCPRWRARQLSPR